MGRRRRRGGVAHALDLPPGPRGAPQEAFGAALAGARGPGGPPVAPSVGTPPRRTGESGVTRRVFSVSSVCLPFVFRFSSFFFLLPFLPFFFLFFLLPSRLPSAAPAPTGHRGAVPPPGRPRPGHARPPGRLPATNPAGGRPRAPTCPHGQRRTPPGTNAARPPAVPPGNGQVLPLHPRPRQAVAAPSGRSGVPTSPLTAPRSLWLDAPTLAGEALSAGTHRQTRFCLYTDPPTIVGRRSAKHE
ncbi:hypothetical protein N7470_010081 [Penicillium chermesinum]|nr:hypothetical protein N7470_010081 [Penicillium chermesinum]